MKVLVSAASKHGSTTEIADAIATGLRSRGLAAVVLEPEEVLDLGAFDAVVLGSAVYAGHWLPPAKELVERVGSGLRTRPVWLFSSGPVGDPPKPADDPVDAARLTAATGAREHRVLAGRLDPARLGLAERALVRALRAATGDFRDWREIDAWAASIAEELTAVPATG